MDSEKKGLSSEARELLERIARVQKLIRSYKDKGLPVKEHENKKNSLIKNLKSEMIKSDKT